MIVELDHLVKGSVTNAELQVCFHALSRYCYSSISIESEKIYKFLKGQISTIYMVALEKLFQSIVDHGNIPESILQESQEDTKRVHHQAKFRYHTPRGSDSRYFFRYNGKLDQAALQGSGSGS